MWKVGILALLVCASKAIFPFCWTWRMFSFFCAHVPHKKPSLTRTSSISIPIQSYVSGCMVIKLISLFFITCSSSSRWRKLSHQTHGLSTLVRFHKNFNFLNAIFISIPYSLISKGWSTDRLIVDHMKRDSLLFSERVLQRSGTLGDNCIRAYFHTIA